MSRFTTTKFISFFRSRFDDKLNMASASIDSDLLMNEAQFEKDVDLRRAKINGFLDMSGSTFMGKLNMYYALVGGNLFMSAEAEFRDVVLREAEIRGKLWMSHSKFKGNLDMASVSTVDDLFMRDSEFGDVVWMIGAKIGDDLSVDRSKFKKMLNMNSVSIGDDLLMRKSKFDEQVKLGSLTVRSNLDARGATLSKLDLTGARIKGKLRIGSWRKKKIEWKGYKDKKGNFHTPKLTLRNANVGALQDTTDTWPDELELDGFTYKRFESGEKKTLSERGSKWFIKWLAKDKSYSPQPYQQLAGVLRSTGLGSIADDILYQNRDEQRVDPKTSKFEWLRLSFLRWFYGYGYGRHIFWALLQVAMILLVSGTLVIYIYTTERRHKTERCDEDIIISGLRDSFWYSVDLLLPVMKLREKHYEIDLETKGARYYFYVHQIIGYLLIFFVIAGLTGLTK